VSARRPKQRRGFASMDPDRVRAIASIGGSEAQRTGRGRRWTVEQARAAGRLGGLAKAAKRKGRVTE